MYLKLTVTQGSRTCVTELIVIKTTIKIVIYYVVIAILY